MSGSLSNEWIGPSVKGVRGPTVLLSTGRYFNFEEPSALTAEEVAHALANICRFTGHCSQFYSVAQHAVLVSYLVPAALAWEGLHHDDGEAVVGDMASPLKALIPAYKTIEKRCERVILAGFGIEVDALPPEIKAADLKALRTEQRDLMPVRGEVWSILEGVEPHQATIAPVAPDIARTMYLARHYELSRRRAEAI